MSKRPRTDFQALIQSDVAPAFASEPKPEPATPLLSVVRAEPEPTPSFSGKGQGTLKQRTRQQSLYLEVPVYEILREIAHTERTSMHALFLEGIDAVLKKRGSPSIRELTRNKPV